ncbi:hypothetical protein [Xenorhabdus littoralis]|uniref:hypothetical protein n=1 Tax=Xenorhabdus littoralis TaxID=2582835 RepID=UPI0029E808B3|nr:hypothetical protein [Xenorhabdus sp. Reich]
MPPYRTGIISNIRCRQRSGVTAGETACIAIVIQGVVIAMQSENQSPVIGYCPYLGR